MKITAAHNASPACLGRANIGDSEAGSTESVSDHIYVPSRGTSAGDPVRRRPVIDADADTRRRRTAPNGATNDRRSPIIDADNITPFSVAASCATCAHATAHRSVDWHGHIGTPVTWYSCTEHLDCIDGSHYLRGRC